MTVAARTIAERKTFAHLRIARLAIDTGYEAPAVYSWSRAQGFAQVSPVKGVEGFNRSSPMSGPTFVDATEGGLGALVDDPFVKNPTPAQAAAVKRRIGEIRGGR